MTPQFMIYGATGYSLGLAAAEAKRQSLPFIIGGRTPSKVKALASQLSVPYRIFSPDDPPSTVDQALQGVKVLVNGAGPFPLTVDKFMDACIRNGVHYFDVAADLYCYEAAEKRDAEAKKVGVMLLPGAGAGVEIILDCVGGRLLEGVKAPAKVEQFANINGPISRGSLKSFREFPAGVQKLVDGDVMSQEDGNQPFDFDNGDGELSCVPFNGPQMITLAKTTGITNFTAWAAKTGGNFFMGDLKDVAEGPDAAERGAHKYHAGYVITGADGNVTRARIHMANGYDLTTLGTVEVARRIVDGDVDIKPGFQTPYSIFGGHFAEAIPGTVVEAF